MWKELIQKLADGCEFAAPASSERLDAAEASLGVRFPDELRSLLGESDGIEGEYGLGLVWPLSRIVQDNLHFRGDEILRGMYMPFDHLLFFGDAGNGDQFASPIRADGVIHRPDVFAWNHEDDSRRWIAPSLKIFFEWWATGKINT